MKAKPLFTCVTILLMASLLALTGCQSMSGLTGPSSQDFVAAANTLAQAESDYFDEIQAASDAAYRLQAAETYVGHGGAFKDFAGELTRHDAFSKAKALRMAAMSQLQNYAQQIAAISSGSDASWVADDAKSATSGIGTLLQDAGAKADSDLLTSHAGVIQSAVGDLGKAIVGSQSAKELQTLAQEAKGPLAQIADMVKQDSVNIEQSRFTTSLNADQTQAIRNILHFIYEDPKVSAFERFEALQITANWKPSLVTKGQAIAAAITKLQAANDAMAQKQDTSFKALAQQAYASARQAMTNSSASN
jgi:hypothetical protein